MTERSGFWAAVGPAGVRLREHRFASPEAAVAWLQEMELDGIAKPWSETDPPGEDMRGFDIADECHHCGKLIGTRCINCDREYSCGPDGGLSERCDVDGCIERVVARRWEHRIDALRANGID